MSLDDEFDVKSNKIIFIFYVLIYGFAFRAFWCVSTSKVVNKMSD